MVSGDKITLPPDAPSPRLCHIRKAFPEEEYGFNLHAEKSRGQYIGKVDTDSPASRGGLRPNDKIFAVNGRPIEGQEHKTVVEWIKYDPLQTQLLVADPKCLTYYSERGITIALDLPNIRSIHPGLHQDHDQHGQIRQEHVDVPTTVLEQTNYAEDSTVSVTSSNGRSTDRSSRRISEPETGRRTSHHNAAVPTMDPAPDRQRETHRPSPVPAEQSLSSPSSHNSSVASDPRQRGNDRRSSNTSDNGIIHVSGDADSRDSTPYSHHYAEYDTHTRPTDRGSATKSSLINGAGTTATENNTAYAADYIRTASVVKPLARLCRLRKQVPSDEYGFNLHAESGRGHFIGKVDAHSLADVGGLRQGQRIVGINGTLIYPETAHNEVIHLIKLHSMKSDLLTVFPEIDLWYQERDLEFSFDHAEVFPEDDEVRFILRR